MEEALTITGLFLSCYFLIRILRIVDLTGIVLASFCLSTAHIVLWGFALSFLNLLSDTNCWAIFSLTTACASSWIFIAKRDAKQQISCRSLLTLSHFSTWTKSWYVNETSLFEKCLLTPLIAVLLLLGLVNLTVVIFVAPHNWDSMTYHLARMAYLLQHNNITYFDANYWAQTVHPKNSSLLLLFTYLVTGKDEKLIQIVQFISYCVAICSVYGISRMVKQSKTESIFAAAISGLLIDWLMEANTTQNDMILAAYAGIIIYSSFKFRKTEEAKDLLLTAIAMGLSIGTKASFLLTLPSIGVVVLYTFHKANVHPRRRIRNLGLLVGLMLLAGVVFAVPSGLYDNYRRFGHPIGPEEVRSSHSFEEEGLRVILRNGAKNLVRYGFDFLSLDGILAIDPVTKVQELLRLPAVKAIRLIGVDLEAPQGTRVPFKIWKRPTAHEDLSYWGIWGFGLVWIVTCVSILGVVKSRDMRVLSGAAVLFLMVQSFSGPYDPWRGRYFVTCAIFAVPVVGMCLRTKNRLLRGYLLGVVLLGCFSSISAVMFRHNSPILSIKYHDRHMKSAFAMDRIEQLARNRETYIGPLKEFDRLVPTEATVAVFLHGDSFEYPLFGEGLTRRLVPMNPFNKGIQRIPASADYLLYTSKGFPCVSEKDTFLGADWYLRRLDDSNRKCLDISSSKSAN